MRDEVKDGHCLSPSPRHLPFPPSPPTPPIHNIPPPPPPPPHPLTSTSLASLDLVLPTFRNTSGFKSGYLSRSRRTQARIWENRKQPSA